MNADEFVAIVVKVVRNPAVSGTLKQLEHPSGKKPRETILRLSEWYNTLTPDDKGKVSALITEAVDRALFGVLSVVDGVRAISEPSAAEKVKLVSVSPFGEKLLNDNDEEFLHDRYQEATGKID